MFLEYYGLREQPFGVTPDPRYLYFSATHREALASLFYGIETGCGFLTLIAPPGMGKTTLLYHLLERLRGSAQTVFLFQTQCGPREMFRYLLADLGADVHDQNLASMHEALNAVLLNNARIGRRFVLFIDEAQNLDNSVFEMVRLLSDFETPQSKLIQIVLAGQPQLADKLALPSLMQLRQRISMVSRLHPFTRVETMVYIEYRLCVAGYSGPPLFSYDAVDLIATQSGGIPRNINNICFNALTLSYAERRKRIEASVVREVLSDLDLNGFGSLEEPMVLKPGRESLSSFDGHDPKDEPTYEEFCSAVRFAWNSGGAHPSMDNPLLGEPEHAVTTRAQSHTSSEPETAPLPNLNIDRNGDARRTAPFEFVENWPGVEPDLQPYADKQAGSNGLKGTAATAGQARNGSKELHAGGRTPTQTSIPSSGSKVTLPMSTDEAPSSAEPRTAGKDHLDLSPRPEPMFLGTKPQSLNRNGSIHKSFPEMLKSASRSFRGLWQTAVAMCSKYRTTGMILAASLATLGTAHLVMERVRPSVRGNGTKLPLVSSPVPSPSSDAVFTAAQGNDADASDVHSDAPHQDSTDGTRIVTVQRGQTFSEISLRYLGEYNARTTAAIQALNAGIKTPDLILAGDQLRLPASKHLNDGNVSSKVATDQRRSPDE